MCTVFFELAWEGGITTPTKDFMYPGAHRAGEAGEGACDYYRRRNSNMAAGY